MAKQNGKTRPVKNALIGYDQLKNTGGMFLFWYLGNVDLCCYTYTAEQCEAGDCCFDLNCPVVVIHDGYPFFMEISE
jgi:hypothetical protein